MAIGSIDNCNQCRPRSTVKQVAKTAVAAAAATGGVLYLAKTGKLNPTEGGNKFFEAIKKGLKAVADPVLEKLSAIKSKVVGKVVKSEIMSKIPSKESVVNGFKTAKDTTVNGAKKAGKGVVGIFRRIGDFVANTIEKFTNPAKFNPEAASVADKAAETFNNFVK